MSELAHHDVLHVQAADPPGNHWLGRSGAPLLGRLLELAFFLRVSAAVGVEWYVRRTGLPRVCVFPDAEYYWLLAGTIREGRVYEIVEWGDIPHFALRTPGYPLFLAVSRALLGERPLGARLVQAALGTLSVWLVYHLTRELMVDRGPRPAGTRSMVPLIAAFLTAVHPFFIGMSVLLLSEAVFVPLMVAALWGLAVAWNRISSGSPMGLAKGLLLPLAIGAANGAAILVRPSWALFIPVMIGGLMVGTIGSPGLRRARAMAAARISGVIVLGLVAVMAPWWVRNARVFGRFVPTAIWMGASLYDGLNPAATGASNMDFLADPEVWPLDELNQDRRLTRWALEFARDQPGRVVTLAIRKLGRYWSPWPNVDTAPFWPASVASGVVMVPLLGFMVLGLWDRRFDARAWVLLAGPILYFCVVHLVFASSMRYRIPGEFPAMGLAAAGLARSASGLGRGWSGFVRRFAIGS
jgi:hypothetical protein